MPGKHITSVSPGKKSMLRLQATLFIRLNSEVERIFLCKLRKYFRKPPFRIFPDGAIFMQVGIKAQARWIMQKEHHSSSFTLCVVQPTRSSPKHNIWRIGWRALNDDMRVLPCR